ncbi:hypothetical protein BSKO_09937 [Bryopsis sp. KO-2023]|nr:hypothetical protein BSKO_09937 [Bryopsis sp. KO-2023]
MESSTEILATRSPLEGADADPANDGSEMKVTRPMEVVVIVACAFVFLMFAYVVIRYIRHGHDYSSMDQTSNPRIAEDNSNSNGDNESEPVLFIEARSERSFNDPSWASSADFPVVIVSVGEDGKASLGYAEEADVSTELVRKDGNSD